MNSLNISVKLAGLGRAVLIQNARKTMECHKIDAEKHYSCSGRYHTYHVLNNNVHFEGVIFTSRHYQIRFGV